MIDVIETARAPAASASPAAPLFSPLEREAIRIGLQEGELTLSRSRLFGLLWLFTGARARPLANAGLEALRAYAELARTLLGRGRAACTAGLVEAGFSRRQIAALERFVGSHGEMVPCR